MEMPGVAMATRKMVAVAVIMILYFFSIAHYRFVNIGVLILFFHDFSDIWLEVSKSILYFKIRNGVEHSLPKNIADVTFTIFTLEWYDSECVYFLELVRLNVSCLCASVNCRVRN